MTEHDWAPICEEDPAIMCNLCFQCKCCSEVTEECPGGWVPESFYSTDNEGVQSDDEAIAYAERHTPAEDKYSEGYCDWCGDEWPCTTASLLYIIRRYENEDHREH